MGICFVKYLQKLKILILICIEKLISPFPLLFPISTIQIASVSYCAVSRGRNAENSRFCCWWWRWWGYRSLRKEATRPFSIFFSRQGIAVRHQLLGQVWRKTAEPGRFSSFFCWVFFFRLVGCKRIGLQRPWQQLLNDSAWAGNCLLIVWSKLNIPFIFACHLTLS